MSASKPSVPTLFVLAIFLFGLTATAAWAAAAKKSGLYSFQGAPDGIGPTGRMATDDKGNLYGVTTLGSTLANGCGAQCGMVFEVTPPNSQSNSWTETLLYDFQGVNVGEGDFPLGLDLGLGRQALWDNRLRRKRELRSAGRARRLRHSL